MCRQAVKSERLKDKVLQAAGERGDLHRGGAATAAPVRALSRAFGLGRKTTGRGLSPSS
jgi:hypothetical protein